MQQPINNIEWRDPHTLKANDYNPNVVLNQELQLLKISIEKTGWIQPILINKEGEIIDGFHRSFLAKQFPSMCVDGKVPCAVIEIDDAERKMLTVRINRAKGNHVAVKMHELVVSLVGEHGLTKEQVAHDIGATKDEIDLLLMEDVFDKKNIKEHKYSKAWVPSREI